VNDARARNTAGKRAQIVASSVRVEGGFVPRSEIQIASVAGTTISIAASRCRCRSVAFAVRPRAQRLGRRVSRYAPRSAAPHSDRRKQLIRRQPEPLLLIARCGSAVESTQCFRPSSGPGTWWAPAHTLAHRALRQRTSFAFAAAAILALVAIELVPSALRANPSMAVAGVTAGAAMMLQFSWLLGV
jgi:hypothetical protein